MRYSTIVEKDDKTLLEIIDMLEQFEKDKFIAGLQMRHYSQFQIEQTLDMVRSRIMGTGLCIKRPYAFGRIP